MRMKGKSCSISLMTDITYSHLLFINSLKQYFLKNYQPANLNYHPILSHPVSVNCSQMAISLMLDKHIKGNLHLLTNIRLG